MLASDTTCCPSVYALMQFCIQLCMSLNYACTGYAAIMHDPAALSLAMATNPYILTVYCLSSPICLFVARCSRTLGTRLTSKVFSRTLRKAYAEMLMPA